MCVCRFFFFLIFALFLQALTKANNLQKELDALTGGPFLHTLTRISELETLPLSKLKQLQEQLREDLEKIEKVIMIFFLTILFSTL